MVALPRLAMPSSIRREVVLVTRRDSVAAALADILDWPHMLAHSRTWSLTELLSCVSDAPRAAAVDVVELFTPRRVPPPPTPVDDAPSIALVGHRADVDPIVAALNVGIVPYILEDQAESIRRHLFPIQGIDEVYLQGGRLCMERVRRAVSIRQETAALSRRETQVLLQNLAGRTYSQMADALGIALKTAKNHATSLFNKLGAGSRQEVVARFSVQAVPALDARGPGRQDDGLGHGRGQGPLAPLLWPDRQIGTRPGTPNWDFGP